MPGDGRLLVAPAAVPASAMVAQLGRETAGGDAWLAVDAEPATGAAQVRAAIARASGLGAEPGTVGELRVWG